MLLGNFSVCYIIPIMCNFMPRIEEVIYNYQYSYQSKMFSSNNDYLKELSPVSMNSYIFLAYFYMIGHLPKCHLFIV